MSKSCEQYADAQLNSSFYDGNTFSRLFGVARRTALGERIFVVSISTMWFRELAERLNGGGSPGVAAAKALKLALLFEGAARDSECRVVSSGGSGSGCGASTLTG